MQYHHSTKAGNPGDVVKHVLLAELLARLRLEGEEMPVYFETHAGPAMHLLEPGGEWLDGLGALSAGDGGSAYERLVLAEGDGMSAPAGWRTYPGSSLIAWTVLKARKMSPFLVLCEIDPAVGAGLEDSLSGIAGDEVEVRVADGYGELGRSLASGLRPCFVLLDPPFFEPLPVRDALERCRDCSVPALAWLPVLALPGELPSEVQELTSWSIESDIRCLRAAWTRPGRKDRCMRGCLCLGAAMLEGCWEAVVKVLGGLGLPGTWELYPEPGRPA